MIYGPFCLSVMFRLFRISCRVRSTYSNLVPWGVELCVRKHMNAWRNLVNDSGFSFRPVGDINHGFGRHISHNKVKTII
jgi:hypothetical protein